MAIASEADFHTAVHGSVGTPSPGVKVISRHKFRIRKKFDKAHKANWAVSRVNLKSKSINIDVYIDFQKNSLSTSDYQKLKQLAIQGIQRYWSRKVTLGGAQFQVLVNVHYRRGNSIDVDLYVETSTDYARSHNSGIIDASFFYNKGVFGGFNTHGDNDFMLVAAHEFGHSVLEYFGSKDLSWGHKGSTNKILQSVKSSTPGYPSAGEIDLMRYYNANKHAITSRDRYKRSIADEKDVKRLIWLSDVTVK
jgi:hypothetical protein